jgi:AraC-like DNA-binding protein
MHSLGPLQRTDERQSNELLMALVSTIDRWTRELHDCDCLTPIPNLTFFRRENPAKPVVCLVEQSIVVVVQGAKQMWLGGQAYPYDSGHFLITSLDLPANSEVITASPEKPCLGLTMKIELQTIAELLSHGGFPISREQPADTGVGIGIGKVTPSILDGFRRMANLLDDPSAIEVLAPLIQREICYRLLTGDQAARLRQIASSGSQGQRIARAIDWLKTNYRLPFRVEELADRVQMSASSLHHHFRQLTGMSPLQYQKWMRLTEARRLMLNEDLDAASSAFQVGYESPSQFSREYSRLFGTPPKRDIENLRLGALVPGLSKLRRIGQ